MVWAVALSAMKLIPHSLIAEIMGSEYSEFDWFWQPGGAPKPFSALPLGVRFQHSPSSDFGENQLSRGLISLSLLLSSHPRIFQHPRVRSSTWFYPGFNLLKSRSPPLRVYCPQLNAHFVLAFASPPFQKNLGWPRTITRRLIMQKAGRHPDCSGLRHIVGKWFQVLFHSPSRGSFHLSLAVLVHYRLPRSI